ncbi:MAG: ABC transporter substrate-binding protein [Clostridia bacterium]|nr:ABC transporter substrate-binding protein [Clostridia bacterium]
MKKLASLLLALVLTVGALAGCAGTPAANTPAPGATAPAGNSAAPENTGSLEGTTIKVGASPAPHAEILEVVKGILAEQGITLDIVEFDDYVLPNTALEEGDLDANYFQHITYLNNFNDEHGTHLVSVANIHYEPFAIYPGQAAALTDLKDGDKIAVPDDGTNEARALLLLETQGLIKLKDGAGLAATKLDIAENPHNYDIVEMEAKLLPSALQDVAVAVINGNYALGAGLTSDQALVFEDASKSAEPYVNVLAVKEGNENNPAIQALVAALESDAVKSFMEEKYGSAVVPAF